MGTAIAYIIGLFCLLFPRAAGKVLAQWVYQMYRHKYGEDWAPSDERKVRPIVSILVGIVVLTLTYLIDISN